jgi:hypothetical protein
LRTDVRRRPRGPALEADAHKGVVLRGLVHPHGAAPPPSVIFERRHGAWVGIDWAEAFHLAALGHPDQGVMQVRRVEHTPAAVDQLI